MSINSIDSGSYLLIIRLDNSCNIAVGALGNVTFQRGWYVYVGSARRYLSSRIARHRRHEKKIRWHIDYLLQFARVVKVFVSTKQSELQLGKALLNSSEFKVVKRFGSSDSPLPGHLFFCARAESTDAAVSALPRSIRAAVDEYPPELT